MNSDYLKTDLIENYSISKDKIFSIPFWSSLENYNSKRERSNKEPLLKIGCPGRIEDVKNQQLIIESLKDFKLHISYGLYIAGSGDNEEFLKSKIQNYNLESKVHFLGVLSIEEMKLYYEEMDIIILPSKFEAFGLVLIEALSMGCPVLVSENFGALTYIKDRKFLNKYSFNPKSSNDLISKLNNIFANEMDSSDYFIDIYLTYFQKKEIIAQVEKVITL